MSAWVLTAGVICGLVALVSATLLLWLEQSESTERFPRWLRLGLSLVACGSMLLYGGSLIGSFYLAMTRCVSVMSIR
jgi:hypothetical protein